MNRQKKNALKGKNTMDFVSPKVDYALKKIFGSEESKEILIKYIDTKF